MFVRLVSPSSTSFARAHYIEVITRRHICQRANMHAYILSGERLANYIFFASHASNRTKATTPIIFVDNARVDRFADKIILLSCPVSSFGRGIRFFFILRRIIFSAYSRRFRGLTEENTHTHSLAKKWHIHPSCSCLVCKRKSASFHVAFKSN